MGQPLVEKAPLGAGRSKRSTATTVDFHPRPSIHSDLPANERNSLRHFCISLASAPGGHRCGYLQPRIQRKSLRSAASCQIVTVCSQHPHATLDQGNALERRTSTNRSCAVRLCFCRHHFGQGLRATYAIVRAFLLFCGKGKTAGKELEEAWQPLMILPTYGPTKIAPLTSD